MTEAKMTPIPNIRDAYASESARLEKINDTLGEVRLAASPLARCIAPLMVALDWFGAPRALLANLPGESAAIESADIGQLLSAQGFAMQTLNWGSWTGGLDALPVGSIVFSGESACVYLGRLDNVDWWHDGAAVTSDYSPKAGDVLLLVKISADNQPLDAPQVGWLKRLFIEARKEIGGILLVSLVANLLALVISLFTMFVYNTVIPSGAMYSLWTMTMGAIIAILGAWWLRMARVKLLASLTAWAGSRISNIAFRKTFGLPADASARMGVENNLIRLRSIEGVRQWFGGGGGAVSADYPFVVIFLLVIALLGGWIVIVPIVSLLLFAALSVPLAHFVEARASKVGRVSRVVGEFSTVVTRRLRGVRGVRGSALWRKRLQELVAESVEANRDYALANGLTQSLSQALGMLTVLATMGVGIVLVLNQTMSTGGLIATMMLIWRVTTPAQQMFANQVRVRQLGDSTRQLERLLLSVGEAQNPQITSPVLGLTSSIVADRLYYRYNSEQEPALSGVSFEIKPGQVVAVVGPNGAGKSTLMSVLAGIRQLQNGRVLVGGRDIRQFDPADYRAWTGYLPQAIQGIAFSIREMLKLRRPATTDSEMQAALTMVAGAEWWQMIGAESPDSALDQMIDPWREDRDSVRTRFIIRLAAAIIGSPPIILLDDPLGDRDPALDGHFLRLLEALRGTSTIILATHRPDLIQRADQVAVLNDGALVHFGPVAQPQEAPVLPVAQA